MFVKLKFSLVAHTVLFTSRNRTDLLLFSGSSEFYISDLPDLSTKHLNHESSRIADCSAVVTDS